MSRCCSWCRVDYQEYALHTLCCAPIKVVRHSLVCENVPSRPICEQFVSAPIIAYAVLPLQQEKSTTRRSSITKVSVLWTFDVSCLVLVFGSFVKQYVLLPSASAFSKKRCSHWHCNHHRTIQTSREQTHTPKQRTNTRTNPPASPDTHADNNENPVKKSQADRAKTPCGINIDMLFMLNFVVEVAILL